LARRGSFVIDSTITCGNQPDHWESAAKSTGPTQRNAASNEGSVGRFTKEPPGNLVAVKSTTAIISSFTLFFLLLLLLLVLLVPPYRSPQAGKDRQTGGPHTVEVVLETGVLWVQAPEMSCVLQQMPEREPT
jgi:hypothetical protein